MKVRAYVMMALGGGAHYCLGIGVQPQLFHYRDHLHPHQHEERDRGDARNKNLNVLTLLYDACKQ